MKETLESLVLLGGGVLIWGKIGSIILGLGLILYSCYRLNKFLLRTRLIRSYT